MYLLRPANPPQSFLYLSDLVIFYLSRKLLCNGWCLFFDFEKSAPTFTSPNLPDFKPNWFFFNNSWKNKWVYIYLGFLK